MAWNSVEIYVITSDHMENIWIVGEFLPVNKVVSFKFSASLHWILTVFVIP